MEHLRHRCVGYESERLAGSTGFVCGLGLSLPAIAWAVVHGVRFAGSSMPWPLIVFFGLCISCLPMAMLMMLEQQLRLVTLEVGSDGVALRSLRRTRTLSFGELTGAELTRLGVRLHLRDGTELVFSVGPTRSEVIAGRTAAHRLSAIHALVQKGIANAATSTSRASEALRRQGRTTSEWMDALMQNGAYRDASLPDDHLWAIVEDGAQPAEVRAAAAVALRRGLDDACRHRLRVAAETSVVPHVRVVIGAAADADDAGVEEALERLAVLCGKR